VGKVRVTAYLRHRCKRCKTPTQQRSVGVLQERELLQKRARLGVLFQRIGVEALLARGECAALCGECGDVAVEAVLSAPGGSPAGQGQQCGLWKDNTDGVSKEEPALFKSQWENSITVKPVKISAMFSEM
jgi:hypothetical protein